MQGRLSAGAPAPGVHTSGIVHIGCPGGRPTELRPLTMRVMLCRLHMPWGHMCALMHDASFSIRPACLTKPRAGRARSKDPARRPGLKARVLADRKHAPPDVGVGGALCGVGAAGGPAPALGGRGGGCEGSLGWWPSALSWGSESERPRPQTAPQEPAWSERLISLQVISRTALTPTQAWPTRPFPLPPRSPA